ncbi:MAG: MotA/TolQ/ExbB proton channel family protein [Candidatus Gastranaerophilales bacterium]|nr:MotA/TolQ/ExbB proton channel family protein [Candidatus Gastranaerophilales bacterium]
MELIISAIKQDWAVLLPILICSILTLMVMFNRWAFYNDNKRDIVSFIRKLRTELVKNNLSGAQLLSAQLGGVTGELAEEGIRILEEQNENTDFAASFDISTSLAVRKLEQYLSILGTIGGVAPFLGLFGTVVRILYTFQDLALQGNQSAAVATGIGSALIATAFGLGVAIVAVILFNTFQSIVARYESDFQLMKLLFLSYNKEQSAPAMVQQQTQTFPQL